MLDGSTRRRGYRTMIIDKYVGEKYGDLTLICRAEGKGANGYLHYYYCLCKCGNIKRYRLDQARRVGNCGICEDFTKSDVIGALRRFNNGEVCNTRK